MVSPLYNICIFYWLVPLCFTCGGHWFSECISLIQCISFHNLNCSIKSTSSFILWLECIFQPSLPHNPIQLSSSCSRVHSIGFKHIIFFWCFPFQSITLISKKNNPFHSHYLESTIFHAVLSSKTLLHSGQPVTLG